MIAITGEEGDDLSQADALAKEGSDNPAESHHKESSKSEGKSEESKQKEVDHSHESSESSPSESKSKDVTPALGTPADMTKFGSGGGGKETQKSPKEAAGNDKPTFHASPLARKIALEKGIPLGQVKGTGPDGRITKSDVEGYKGGAAAAPAASSSPSAPAAAAYEDVPLSNMRKIIGERLLESKQQIPHYYVTVEVEMGEFSSTGLSFMT